MAIDCKINAVHSLILFLEMILWSILIYRLCQKKLYNFQFLIAENVNKAQQQHSGGQNIIFLHV